MQITENLISLDRTADYIPVISSVSNIVDLFLKYVVVPRISNDTVQNRYWTHIRNKDLYRSMILIALPIIGNICVALSDRFERQQIEHERRVAFDDAKILEAPVVKTEIEALRQSREPGWQERAAKRICKSSCIDPRKELERLRSLELVTEAENNQLTRLVNSFPSISAHAKLQYQKRVGQALAIQKIYGSTHHVFIHSQPFQFLVIVDLIKELEKANYPGRNLKHFKCLRVQQADLGIAQYGQREDHFHDSNRDIAKDILSADACFYNELGSAYYGLHGASMTPFDPEYLKNTIQFYCRRFSAEKCLEYAKKLAEKAIPDAYSNLFVICIPKEISQDVLYRANPGGRHSEPIPGKSEPEILEQLQNGNIDFCRPASPQYRIFMPAALPERGVKSYLLTSNREERKEVKAFVKEMVQEILNEMRQPSSA